MFERQELALLLAVLYFTPFNYLGRSVRCEGNP